MFSCYFLFLLRFFAKGLIKFIRMEPSSSDLKRTSFFDLRSIFSDNLFKIVVITVLSLDEEPSFAAYMLSSSSSKTIRGLIGSTSVTCVVGTLVCTRSTTFASVVPVSVGRSDRATIEAFHLCPEGRTVLP